MISEIDLKDWGNGAPESLRVYANQNLSDSVIATFNDKPKKERRFNFGRNAARKINQSLHAAA